MGDLNNIAGDLNKLLSEVKVKPVVVESKKAPKVVNMEALASELASVVFKTAPVGTKPEVVAEALLHASKVKAREHKLDTQEVFESTIDYCIKVIESAQSKID